MISISLSSIQGVRLNDQKTKFQKLFGCTLNLKLLKFFSQSSIFFLIPTLFDGALCTTEQTKLCFPKCFIELHFSEGNNLDDEYTGLLI